ncbi:ornithine cyclodeaminase family protein [Kiloniella sp. b19]|uniref:ornithine cyclodeaminase family protein n=1 Tax=Kiloniella sp. GXU_MW_B19 TaxID=3141326 RepID=UPI0031D3D0C9
MQNLSAEQVEKALDYPSLIEALKQAFQSEITVPKRHHHDMPQPAGEKGEERRDSTLLLMPAWEAGEATGVKLVTISPHNGELDLPAIQGIYILFDGKTGIPRALVEAKTLTTKRTAAASALAASYLAREDSKKLLMVGTGALAPELIQAHAAVRPIKTVAIWGRSPDKARNLITELEQQFPALHFTVAEELEDAVSEADIISCATLSEVPLVHGDWLKPGQHLDLVGAYRPDMREADNQAILTSRVFVDTREGATHEGGDVAIPLKEGVIGEGHILGDLFSLCRGEIRGRESSTDITLFKSVGHALEDLTAAKLVVERCAEAS